MIRSTHLRMLYNEGDVEDQLKQFVSKHKIPGLWLAATLGGETKVSLAVGNKWNEGGEAALSDVAGIGSLSKYFLADLATLCVLKKQVSWDSRVEEVCSSLMGSSPQACMSASLKQLIIHEGGFPRDHIPWLVSPESEQSQRQWRQDQIATFNGLKPIDAKGYRSPTNGTAPGERMVYSNFGASVAGTMLETVSGTYLTRLFQQELFKPFGLSSAGFGLPNPGAAKKDLLLGHFEQSPDGNWRSFKNWNDNAEPRSMAAAASGGLHMTIGDLVKYLTAKCLFRSASSPPLPRNVMASLWHTGVEVDYSSGAVGGYRSWFKMDRRRKLVVAYNCNANLNDNQTKELESFLDSL